MREDVAPTSAPAQESSAPPRRSYGELLGTSDQMREVRELVGRVADTDVTVLVRGEAGQARSSWRAPCTTPRRGASAAS
jgi:DNA-binding NtrC family response regulator